MKVDRLISIIIVLLQQKRISATKLADMFGVSTRTIYRDIEAINLAGIPIITYQGTSGGIGIMDGYKIDKKLFTTSDILTLLVGLGSISSTLTNEDISKTLAKVKGLIPRSQVDEIEFKLNQISIDLTPWRSNKNLQLNLEYIKIALNDSKVISFKYIDGSGRKSCRVVEPYRLVLKHVNWYLQGYCTNKKDYRMFKLTRIYNLKVLDETFLRREFNTEIFNSLRWIEDRIITIKLLVDESLKDKMLEHCGEENVKKYGEGKLLVDFPFVEDDLGYGLLLSYGDKCKCIEPVKVKEELVRRVRSLLNIYK